LLLFELLENLYGHRRLIRLLQLREPGHLIHDRLATELDFLTAATRAGLIDINAHQEIPGETAWKGKIKSRANAARNSTDFLMKSRAG
jgi:hypothetical protein